MIESTFDELRDPGPDALVGVVESTHREESVVVARRLAAVAGLLRHRVAAAERVEQDYEYAVISIQRLRVGDHIGSRRRRLVHRRANASPPASSPCGPPATISASQ